MNKCSTVNKKLQNHLRLLDLDLVEDKLDGNLDSVYARVDTEISNVIVQFNKCNLMVSARKVNFLLKPLNHIS